MKEKRIYSRGAALAFGLLLVVLLTVAPAAAATWDVSEGESIQAAIDNASAGDTVTVHAGTYAEALTIDKTLTLEGIGNPVIEHATDSSSQQMLSGAVQISGADSVFRGFTINYTKQYCFGIYITANDVLVENNTLTNCNEGIWINGVQNTTVRKNVIKDCWGWTGLLDGSGSSGNWIYLNDFIGNSGSNIQVSGSSQFYSLEEMTYSYGGAQQTGYLGNYYDTYTGTDADNDGIGDTAVGTDDYPLMASYTNYPEGQSTALPVADFSADVTNGDATLTVQFTDASTNSPTSWSWDFGDNGTSDVQNPTHTYDTPGTYTVNLTVANDDGSDSEVKADYITVTTPPGGDAPVASFSANVTSGNAPLTVQFTDASTNTPTSWSWDFGDKSYSDAWTEQNASAGWTARSGHTSVVLPDRSIVLMGGVDGSHMNDVWRSTDNGSTWTCVNASAGWSARAFSSSVALPDGSIVLMGGDTGSGYKNDVWRSTDGGATWTCVNASAGWTARSGHSSVALPDGSIVLMGGSDATGKLNDVWRSTDGGATWTEMNAGAGWAQRMYHTGVALPDGSIVLMGGEDSTFTLRNDVWRSTDDGATWTEMNASAGWAARAFSSSVARPDGSLVLMGGMGLNIQNDMWRSTDNGATWTCVNASAGWTARMSHTSVAMPDGGIILMGGTGDDGINRNDVWYLQIAVSSEQNPTHTYTDAGTYPVTLTVANEAGSDSAVKTDYITVTAGSEVPVADFTAMPTSGDAPLTVQFTDNSTGAEEWAWDFGDGTISDEQNTTHAYGASWTEMNASAGWTGRKSFAAVALPDGDIVLMGGFGSSAEYYDDVWRSTDGGATWTCVNASAPWSIRYSHAAVALPDGSIVLMGGSASSYKNDVWRSTDEGRTWTEMNAGAAWSGRYSPAVVALPDSSIVLMGGGNTGKLNDVWRSTDDGRTWTCVNASAPWSARYAAAAVALPDGSIVLMGGNDATGKLNDVWRSTDGGATWNQLPDAGWSACKSFAAVALPDSSIVLMGGYGATGKLNDVWRSTDSGVTWNQLPDAGWTIRGGQVAVALTNGSVVLMGGRDSSNYCNDVWCLRPVGSTEQNPTHTYTDTGTYPVTLTVANEAGSDSAVKTNYITVNAAGQIINAKIRADADTPIGTPYNDTNLASKNVYKGFKVENDPDGSLYRSLIHFNLSSIPAGATIKSATIYGYILGKAGNGREIAAYRVTDPWNESAVTWNTQPSIATQPTNVSDPEPLTRGWLGWNVTQDVQAYADGTANNGWTLLYTNESTPSIKHFVVFAGRGYATNRTLRPYLNVVYSTSTPPHKYPPHADFTANRISGDAPLTVQFTDYSTDSDYSINSPNSWAWDFDNDGTVDSTEQNPTYTYETPGTYSISLTVTNDAGSDTKVMTDAITVTGDIPEPVGLSFSPVTAETGVNGTTEVSIVVDALPAGLSGYNLTVTLDDPAVANITGIAVPTWATLNATGTLSDGSVWVQAADLGESISAGAANVTLATLTLTGISAGTANITASVTRMDGDDGSIIEANVTDGRVLVSSATTVPGCENPPCDLDGDGICDDVNGNARFDFDDVVTFFDTFEWVAGNEPTEAFDVNGNGRIDYADLVGLYKKL